ncbi:ParB/Srx family N-terminal domain-containing protein [Streptomyces shenzhenensis]|uniref:Chromosome partitioning protein ParB n=1 Tax=Streptomyces shenzhenensis TaxID=943815 RepID=A0A3M0I9B9_9ACTN|nr:ParB/Srx family N-terminal domain-containing protein [Streptomyces shenzhenensis]RMB85455.1 chromosome partitioning protein ParB [Streptomyces shenzhenensis]
MRGASAGDRSGTGRRRRTAAALTAVALAAGAIVTGAGAAQAKPQPQDCGAGRAAYACVRPGELLDVTLGELHPTQSAVGYDEIYYKLGRYRLDKDVAAGDFNKRFDDWCEANGQGETASARPGARLDDPASFSCTVPLGQETADSVAPMKTAVVGPGGKLYLTDGHHTFTVFDELPDGGDDLHVRVRITDNFSSLSTAAFWQRMTDEKKVWLRDENDRPITVGQLPDRLGLAHFHDDAYRSLVYFTRDIGYAVPDDASEFLEFSWGSWLRGRLPVKPSQLNDSAPYLSLVKQASQAMVALADDDLVAGGRTAAELGKMAEWNDGKKETGGEFAKLSRAITEAKPGKLAYALGFKADVAPAPSCTTTLTGTRSGPLTVGSGVTCLDRARLTGPVTVRAGASLISRGSTVSGPVAASGARTVQLCGTTVNGPVSITRTDGPVLLGGPGCTADAVTGPVALTGNTGGVTVSGGTVTGPLACSANSPAPSDAGKPVTVRGPRSGQCATL